MSDNTTHLGLPYIAAAQAQKHVTHNEAIRSLDALVQLSVLDRDLSEPPGAPTDGDRYIVAASGTGIWAGKDGQVAAWQDNAWMFYAPNEGWLAWVADEDKLLAWDGAVWNEVSGGGGSANLNPADGGLVGVNATADVTNRLSVNAPATLFNHEGAGHQVKLNKAAVADTASLLYQTAFSGRAEIGLTGDDDLHLKVSPDGSNWHEGLVINRHNGEVTFPNTSIGGGGASGGRVTLDAARTYYVRTDGNDANTGLGDSAGEAFATIQKALDTVYGTLDLFGFDVTIQLGNGTYTEDIKVSLPQVGGGKITLLGDAANPANVLLQNLAGVTLSVSNIGTVLYVSGVKTVSSIFACWSSTEGGLIKSAGPIEFGAAPNAHMFIWGGNLELSHEVTVSGDCPGMHLQTGLLGKSSIQTATWNLVGNPSIGTFIGSTIGALVYTYGNSFAGTMVGKRFDASINGIIITNSGANPSFFPGTVAGTVTTGGQYS